MAHLKMVSFISIKKKTSVADMTLRVTVLILGNPPPQGRVCIGPEVHFRQGRRGQGGGAEAAGLGGAPGQMERLVPSAGEAWPCAPRVLCPDRK